MLHYQALFATIFGMLLSAASVADAEQPIELVAAFNLTGPEAVLDLPCYHGAELAVEQLNASGGVLGRPVKLVVVDTGSVLPATAELVTGALRKHPDVVAGIGFTYSSFVLAAGPVFQAAGLPFVTPGTTDPSLPTRIGDDIFLACYGDDAQAEAMAQYAYEQLKLRRVALWADDGTDYTKTVAKFFEDAFTALGGAVVRTDYPSDETDFAKLINAFKKSDPPFDAIYSASRPQSGEAQIEQCRAAGIDVPLLSGDGWDDPKIAELSKQHDLSDIYFTTHRFRGVESPEMKSFVAAYKTRFGHSPSNAFAPLGYDTINLIVAAIRQADSTDPADIRSALADITDFPGIAGPITYKDGSRVPIKLVEVIHVQDGKQTPVWQVTPTQ